MLSVWLFMIISDRIDRRFFWNARFRDPKRNAVSLIIAAITMCVFFAEWFALITAGVNIWIWLKP